MNLNRAIEILKLLPHHPPAFLTLDELNATELLIEAGKFRQRWEDQEGEADFPLLPGETKD